jgi:cyclic pyranopterin phosphate synthase
MPNTPFSWVPKENLLSFEELFMFLKVAIDRGIEKIRITGGEPTLRADLDKFIHMISSYNSDLDLAMTTNAYFLDKLAKPLKEAGLKRLNISIDTLIAEKAKKISQKSVLPKVLKGIYKALDLGFEIKLNTVPIKGINDDEICDLIEFSKKLGVKVRFIEFMENSHADQTIKGLKADEILNIIKKSYTITDPIKDINSPARYYDIGNHSFGIIEPHKEDFCGSCNRIRLTAEGMLVPCLYFKEALSIKEALRENNINKAMGILDEVLQNKPEKNNWSLEKNEVSNRAFYETGG